MVSLNNPNQETLQKKLLQLFQDIIALVFPKICYGCGTLLDSFEKVICTACHVDAPLTDFHLLQQNNLQEKFKEWFAVRNATALFYFQKEGVVAALIHQFKYNGVVEIGVFLGNWLGWQIKESPFYKEIHLIVPVPLHRKRERKRGFNQALIIAKEISSVIEVPLMENALVRKKNTKQLAHIGIDERWKEIENAFEVNPILENSSKNFLLVDDVITTGATLNACSQSLQKCCNGEISIAALAFRL